MPNKDGGWVLPDVIDPARVCVQLYIPNDFHHRAAFWGALYELTRWYNWQRDDLHKGREAAEVWKEVWRLANTAFYAGQGCEVQTLLRMSSDCGTIQVSYDGGAIWENLTDLSACISAGVAQGIQDALDDGTVAGTGQQGAGGTVPSLQCKTYKITLRGNSRWYCPNPVKAGYSITVSNATGATGDNGNITANWGCADGKIYALGACTQPLATQPTDPLQSQPHLRLIGYCAGVYMDMYNTQYVVPQGVPDNAFFLQVNDGNLSDNQGELQLAVTVCNFSEWRKYWNALDNDFVVLGSYGVKDGADFVGTGWPGLGRNQLEAKIDQNSLAGTTITKVRALYSTDNAWDSYVFTWPDGSWRWTWNQANGVNLWAEDSNPVYTLGANSTLSIRMSAHNNGVIRLHRFEVYGSGNVLPGGHEF